MSASMAFSPTPQIRVPANSAGGVASSSPAQPVLPVDDSIDTTATGKNPYTLSSQPVHASNSELSSQSTGHTPPIFFHSRRVKKGEISRPWLEKKDPREKWVTIIPCAGLLLGLAVCSILVWQGMNSVVNHRYCPILMEDWSDGYNDSIWTREAQVGGFGNGQFEYTTTSKENSWVEDGVLHIRPTLQDEKLITTNGAILNLTAMGICSSQNYMDCVTITNTTEGHIVNPVNSARLTTRNSKAITYGRIEVRAKLPAGKWLWPAIWMLPLNETYGPWPASGEMDIAESRGNGPSYPEGGDDIISSTLHWGPDTANDGWLKTSVKHKALHTTFAKKYHTFGIEWSENYIFTYVDSRLQQVLYTNFNERLWGRGNFPLANVNGTRYIDPWAKTGRRNTPFDQPFYLVIDVAAGGTNGYFTDGVDGKPWVDGSVTSRKDFWDKRDEWYPTWENNGEMLVKSVKMWQQCG